MELSPVWSGADGDRFSPIWQYGVWALQLGWLVSSVAKLLRFRSALALGKFLRLAHASASPALAAAHYGTYRTLEYTGLGRLQSRRTSSSSAGGSGRPSSGSTLSR